MKKIKFILVLLCLILFSSCGQKDVNYVKDIYLSKYEENYILTLNYYNFESSDEEYIKAEYISEKLDKLPSISMSEYNYNFRLCERCLINQNIIYTDFEEAFKMLESFNLPPSVEILGLEGNIDDNFILKNEAIDNPIYSLSVKEGIYGEIPIYTGNGDFIKQLIIDNGEIKAILDKRENQILELVRNSQKNIFYVTDDNVYAHLINISNFINIDSNININITFALKDFKGMSDTQKNRDGLKIELKKELEYNIKKLLNNKYIFNSCFNNLKHSNKLKNNEIVVKVKII